MELEDKRLELRVGLLIFAGIVLLLLLAFFFQSFAFHRNYYTIEANFPFGGGIRKGTPVRVAGYDVGKVSSVQWDSQNQVVRAVLLIDTQYKIKRDAVLIVDAEGMLGETYLEFTPGSKDGADLEAGAVVSGEVPPTMTQLKVESVEMIKKITDAVGQIESLASHLNSVVGEKAFQDNIKSTVANTAKIAEQAAKSAEGVQKISENVSRVIGGTETLVSKLNAAADGLIEQINERGKQAGAALTEAEGLLKELRATNRKLNDSLENISDISLKIREGDGTIHKLIYERELYDRANTLMADAGKAARKLTELADYLKRNPSHLVWGSKPSWYKRAWRSILHASWGEDDDQKDRKKDPKIKKGGRGRRDSGARKPIGLELNPSSTKDSPRRSR